METTKGIFQASWADKGRQPAVEFVITNVYAAVKGAKEDYHLIEISEEMDGDKAKTIEFIREYLTGQGITAVNLTERTPIK